MTTCSCPVCGKSVGQLSTEYFYECSCGTAALLCSAATDEVLAEISFYARQKGIHPELVEQLGQPTAGRYPVELTPQAIADFGDHAIPKSISALVVWVRPFPR